MRVILPADIQRAYEKVRERQARRGRRNGYFYGYWAHRNRDGNIVDWGLNENITHDLGEQFICQALFSEQAQVPLNYYMGLDNRASLAKADTEAGLTEPNGSYGYARIALASDANDWTIGSDANGYYADSAQKQFQASGGDWTIMRNLFLATALTGGILLGSVALSPARTVLDGEKLDAQMRFVLKEPA